MDNNNSSRKRRTTTTDKELNKRRLFTKNKEVQDHNNMKIQRVGNPIILVEADNTGRARMMREDNFGRLSSSMYLCVGVKVVLTRNYLNIGLSNSSTGIVKEIVYDRDKPVLGLPRFAFADFGNGYIGPTFFPKDISR